MNIPAPTTLPLREAAHALMRARFEEMTDAELAAVDFGPWPLAELCEVPTPRQWEIASAEVPNVLMVAAQVVRNNKAGLVAKTAAMEDAGLDEFLEGLKRWRDLFRQHLALMEAAQDRMTVALAALHQQNIDGEASPADLENGREISGSPGGLPMPEISPDMKRMIRKFELSASLLDKQAAGTLSYDDERPIDWYHDVFFDVCRSPVSDVHRLELMHKCIDRSMKEGRDSADGKWTGAFQGSIEDAIDVVLEYALEHTHQPFDTAILALIRYRIEQQRKQAMNG